MNDSELLEGHSVSAGSNRTNCSAMEVVRLSSPPIIHNRGLLVAVATFLCLIAALTLFLNVVVIIAVCWTSSRRCRPGRSPRAGNNTRVVKLLMASMAVADAVVALMIMPLRISEIVHNGKWVFPIYMCKFRSLASVLLCNVSIYHVMGMAIDRYLAICRPMMYRMLTVKTGCVMAALFWCVPLTLNTLPLALKWIFVVRSRKECEINKYEYCRTKMYELYSVMCAFITFYIPFTVIYVLYVRVLLEIRKVNHRSFGENRIRKILKQESQKTNKDNTDKRVDTVRLQGSIEYRKTSKEIFRKSSSSTQLSSSVSNKKAKMSFSGSASFRKSGIKRKSTKALLTIGLIVLTFTVTWLPFSVFKVVFGYSKEFDFPPWVFTLTIWMGYFNSTLNPVLFCLHNGVRSSERMKGSDRGKAGSAFPTAH
ncbi:hypothetical protein Btru_050927 [Bulinus truncatus]|nr:hypothetical protein Btru_050927 [Bulinus truncatus]